MTWPPGACGILKAARLVGCLKPQPEKGSWKVLTGEFSLVLDS